MTFRDVISVLGLASLQGLLVALPRAKALAVVSRLRSPAWAALLPGSILVGTFGPLWWSWSATALAVAAAVVTPVLALVAAVAVQRGRWGLLLPATLGLVIASQLAPGAGAQVSGSLVTAFGCLCLGVGLTRLIAARWLLAGVVAMCGVDVLLLALGPGQLASAAMAQATAHLHHWAFASATIGRISIDYPDLVLAGVVGGVVAGRPWQGSAALTLTSLAGAYGMLLAFIDPLPATVPIALTCVFVAGRRRVPPTRSGQVALLPTRDAPRVSRASPAIDYPLDEAA